VTAHQLHHLFASTAGEDTYEGGFNLRRPLDNRITGRAAVESRFGDIDLTVSTDGDRGTALVVQGLEPSEAREMALMLDRAAAAAERAREKENE
jgi:hypothetical protein